MRNGKENTPGMISLKNESGDDVDDEEEEEEDGMDEKEGDDCDVVIY